MSAGILSAQEAQQPSPLQEHQMTTSKHTAIGHQMLIMSTSASTPSCSSHSFTAAQHSTLWLETGSHFFNLHPLPSSFTIPSFTVTALTYMLIRHLGACPHYLCIQLS